MRKIPLLFFHSIIFFSIQINSQIIPIGNYPFNHIDVLEYKIEIDLRESFELENRNLTGIVDIKCKVDTIAIEEIYLDAVSLIIDSVFVNEEKVSFNLTDKYLIPLLPQRYDLGDTLNIRIFYKRQDQETPGYYFRHYSFNGITGEVAYTFSWQTNTRYWLPCKDWPTDKAYVEMKVTVPQDIIAVSNGELFERIDENDYSVFVWREKHPMATYVISISASNYISIEKKIPRFSNPSDSIRITYYTLPEALTQFEEFLETVPELINYYSWRFVEFPFDCLSFVAPGTVALGMSNQTLIQFNRVLQPDSNNIYFVLPHEVAHQWFGSFVNSSDWNLWITEGLASYASALYNDFVLGNTYRSYIKWMSEIHLRQDSLNTLKSPPTVALEMLRTTLGDSVYWESFRNYLNTSAYGSATITDLNEAVNRTTGDIYNWFFDEWFYNPGYPEYNISWETEKIFSSYYTFVRVEQTQVIQDIFTMPVDITVTTEVGKTTSKVMNNQRVQVFEFRTTSEPVDVIFDRDTLLYLKEVRYEIINFTPEYSYKLEQNYPNPFNPTTKIEYRISQSGFVSLKLYDILGNEVKTLVNEEKQPGIYGIEINGNSLASGIYFYKIRAGFFTETKKMILLK
jgi:aminopeptidase N